MTAPFGIEFHTPVENLEIVRELGQGKYFVTPPKLHPSFESYVVQATPSVGICWIKGISPAMSNDAFGAQARQLHGTLRSQLEKRYSTGAYTDRLLSGSIWDEPRYWTQGLTANERHCYVIWERPAARQLPDDVDSIFLGVNGLSSDDTSVSLEYASVRMKQAEAELQDMLSDLL
ncbi:hypothetical protein SAQ01S_24420 [Sphingomonas aquatilis NBRC 16722]|uniref:Uncharacterized protein n=1 Tax=Sphingomonas aquatilis TaxID=93063 RepID=A0AAW3TU41_9SPHN|nr:hypothetical protein [Sphingomonas aquatilis]MBB3874994.1 hypothetical protein [Sphingomonas aquatilis]MCP4069684.1 hypothetical protein [Phycisphaeraceae bacterium]GEM72676.1 hypothetical protein SAQ01S_24420 [Sphingomonas aquatilis NBRC 16722]